MSMFTAFNISASGMTAQQLRTDVISENIAASRSYEANISAFNASKSMASKGLSIGSAT